MENINKNSWHENVKRISEGIKKAVIDESVPREKLFRNLETKADDLGEVSDAGILDVCLEVKSVLAMINFGEVEPSEKDREFVRRGILSIIDYFSKDSKCYNMVGQLRWEYCLSAFGDSDAYINRTMANVFLTFVYFRRAVKRKGFLSDINDYDNLNDRIAVIMKDIIKRWLCSAKENNYRGWGFMTNSKSINLADTYRVVEAISKFQDACDSSDENKRDDFIIDKIGCDLTASIEDAMYKVALNVYDETANCYGEGVFYKADETAPDGKAVYRLSNSEQVLNSNRTSALFQPLYVAMITMLGYTDKEVVIRKLMTSKESAESCFNSVLSEVTKENGREADIKVLNANSGLKEITKEHAPLSELSDEDWKKLYDAARSLEKDFEKYAKGEMSRGIKEYRDYLNKTKDAIDNIQVYYRKFNDAQKLGIVDADYAIFSNLDIPNIDIVDLSRLNKSNIVTSYLKPLLLSSKIMIVNALTKYPQADMEALFTDIMDSVYRKRNGKKKGATEERIMLWNEEEIDMFATACNCDSIAYDYFDYYAKYELNYRAMTRIFNETQNYIIDKGALQKEDIDFEVAADEIASGIEENEKTAEIVGALFDIAKAEIKSLKDSYEKQLKENKKIIESESRKVLESKNEEIDEKDRALTKFSEENKSLREESKIADVIQELIDRKIKEELEKMMGTIALYNMKPEQLRKGKGIAEMSDEDIEKYPHSVRVAIKKMKSDTADLDKEKRDIYFNNIAANAKQTKDMFDLALSGVMNGAIATCFKGDIYSILEAYDEFKNERADFLQAWALATVGKRGVNNKKLSLEHIFSVMDSNNIYILGDKSKED